MKNNFIVHVPHSSIKFTDEFWNYTILDREHINEENIFMSDYMVDKFLPNGNDFNIIKFDYSRLFCDVERFKDDSVEEMSKVGMGAIYNKDSNGLDFINPSVDYKNKVIKKYYDIHHKLLDDVSNNIIQKFGVCYIIDLHSFSDEFVSKIFGYDNTPDICIGTDEKNLDKKILDLAKSTFKKYGYSVMINYPYSGTIVPNKYIKSNSSSMKSIMIEINKRIYLDNNIKLNDDKYLKLKKCMDEFYDELKNINN